MARLATLPSVDIISGYRGKVDYYVWLGLPCARRWPRNKNKTRAAAVQAQWSVFTDAVNQWSELAAEVRDAYKAMATGSTLSGRDMMVKMYINAKSILPY